MGIRPKDRVLPTAEVRDSVPRVRVPVRKLPSKWRSSPAPAELVVIGDGFLASGRAAILIVPSAIAPPDFNWLLNPAHAEFSKIRIGNLERLEKRRR